MVDRVTGQSVRRLVSVLEGGYHLDMLADRVAVHLAELLKKQP